MSSKHICLQNILFDNLGIPDETKPLFIRPGRIQNGNNVSAERSSIILPAGTKLDLNTYFNNFTYRKWMEWCFIEGVSLQFTYSGDLVVEVFSTAGCRRKQISSLQLTGSGRAVIPILAENDPQLLSVVLHTRTESRIADAGWYGVPSFPENRRSIAIVICTYKRMDYLKNTLAVLREHLPAGWQVLTVDNDSSITDEFRANYDTRFAFFNNPNTGGSGGFTRGLIEAIARKCTHAVLMDDDISLDPEALQRTDSLLALLRPEYSTRFIAGAMFRMDKPSIQHESTAVWNGIKVHSQKHNLDMTKKRSICRNEKPDRRTQRYAGWWYCGIPLTKGIEHDLPFPMFVGGDDIEYSLRRAKGLLEFNGICVWHEHFAAKYNPVRQHYLTTRNGLIINALHGFPLYRSVLLVWLRLAAAFLKRDREARRLIRWGAADFLEGAEYVRRLGNPFAETGLENKNGGYSVPGLRKRYRGICDGYKNAAPDMEYWSRINQ